MNTPFSNIALLIIGYGISWFLILWLAYWLMGILSRILNKLTGNKLGKRQWVALCAIKLRQGLLILLGLYCLSLYASEGAKEHDKFMANYKSPRQQRLEFLEAHCKQVDIEYEALNNGKLIYKCPNGKEYKV